MNRTVRIVKRNGTEIGEQVTFENVKSVDSDNILYYSFIQELEEGERRCMKFPINTIWSIDERFV